MTSWTDFNDAPQQNAFDVIPKGTLAPVRMLVRPGGYDDPAQGWLGWLSGFATCNKDTGSVYLDCEFIILEGPFTKRKIWSIIGLLSRKGPTWGQMGRTFIRAVLNSAYNISPKDMSPQAAARRRITGLGDLDGITFLARIDIEKNIHNDPRNVIKMAVKSDHPQYTALMHITPNTGVQSPPMPVPTHPFAPAAQTQHATQPASPAIAAPAQSNRHGWA